MGPARVSATIVALLALLSSFLLGAVAWTAPPAHAAERVITITAEGVTPKVLTVAAGDTVRFVNEDTSFAYRAVSTSDNWTFDSGPVGLLPGRSFTVPDPIAGAGTYRYQVAQDAPFQGSVVVPASTRPSAQPSPTRRGSTGATASPAPTAEPMAPPAGSGGAGEAGPPPLQGGVGAVDTAPQPTPGGVALPPTLAAPLVPGESLRARTPQTAAEAAGEPSPAPLGAAAVRGDLPGAGSTRGLGLPAALAIVFAAGVISLLVRLLLAEPVTVSLRGAAARSVARLPRSASDGPRD